MVTCEARRVTRVGPRILTLRGRLWHYGHWHGHSRGGEGEGGGVKREQQDASSHTLSTLFGCVDMVDMAALDFFPTVDEMNVEY